MTALVAAVSVATGPVPHLRVPSKIDGMRPAEVSGRSPVDGGSPAGVDQTI